LLGDFSSNGSVKAFIGVQTLKKGVSKGQKEHPNEAERQTHRSDGGTTLSKLGQARKSGLDALNTILNLGSKEEIENG
jgi:hypothetical protein